MEKRERKLNKLLTHFQPGTIIFKEGDISNDLFILKKGKVSVRLKGEHIAEISESGTYLGEMSALLGEPRTATLKAETFCQFYVIPGDKIFKLVLDNPTIGIKLLGILADRLRNTNMLVVRKDKEIETLNAKYDRLKKHYLAVMNLASKANIRQKDDLFKSIIQYADKIEPVENARLDYFNPTFLTAKLKQLLKL